MNKLNFLDWTALVLLFVGGLNWGLVGLFNFDLVSAIFGQGALFSRLVFSIVGIASLFALIFVAPKVAGLQDDSLMDSAGRRT